MLIDKYDLEVFTPACDPGTERYAAMAHLRADIVEVLPYLNATLPGALYSPASHTLSWRKGGHYVIFHADRIGVSNVEDRDAAGQEIDALIQLVNRIWERRGEVQPDFEAHQRPTPMALYKLLPHTNCRQCGEPTCFTFALKLAASQRTIADCPPLFEPARAAQLAALQTMVIEAPAIE